MFKCHGNPRFDEKESDFSRNLNATYLIQETHASLSDYNFWKSQWGDDLWMSYGSNRAAGVAILKGTFKGKNIQTNIHDSGRYSGDIGNRKEY